MELFFLIIMFSITIRIETAGKLLRSEDFVASTGYPYEKHGVITEDNYKLEIDRIPLGLNKNSSQNRPPVLLVHGIGGSSTDFMLLGVNQALAFQLADNGYDVWLAICRGAFYTTHTTFDENSSNFWNFSFHEIGVYDIPAVIDYIINFTGYQQVTYIGHSQGGTACFAMLSEKPEYNTKILALITYSPAVFLCNSKYVLTKLGHNETYDLVTNIRHTIGDFNIIPSAPFISQLCQKNFLNFLCDYLLDVFGNLSLRSLPNLNFTSMILKYGTTGISIKQIIHFWQLFNHCKFAQFQNSINERPREYNLSNVKIPVYAFSGKADIIETIEDMKVLENKLPNGFTGYYEVPGIGHNDYIFGKYSTELIYKKTLEILYKLHKS